jgi:hypothetical protein
VAPPIELLDQHTAQLVVEPGGERPGLGDLQRLLADLPAGVTDLVMLRAGQTIDHDDLGHQRRRAGAAALFTPRVATQAIKEVGPAAIDEPAELVRSLDRTRVAIVDFPQLLDRQALANAVEKHLGHEPPTGPALSLPSSPAALVTEPGGLAPLRSEPTAST